MSNALICDTCTQVFPEGAEGSVSGNGTFTRTVDGVRKELNKRQDQCPTCADTQNQRWNGARTLEAPKMPDVPMREAPTRGKFVDVEPGNGRNFTLGGDYS